MELLLSWRNTLFDSPSTFLLIAAIIFAAATIRSTLGFGDAVLALPLLNILIDPQLAQPLMALCSLTSAIWMTWRDWRDMAFDKTWRLLLTVVIGLPIGVMFLKLGDPRYVKIGLGVLVIGFAIFRATGGAKLQRTPHGLTYAVGLLAGILCGAYNVLGVVLAVYGAIAGWEVRQLRMTLQGVMLPAGFVLVGTHAAVGLLTVQTLQAFAFVLPLLILAGVIGQVAAHRVKPSRFDKILTGSLFAMGSVLLWRTIVEL